MIPVSLLSSSCPGKGCSTTEPLLRLAQSSTSLPLAAKEEEEEEEEDCGHLTGTPLTDTWTVSGGGAPATNTQLSLTGNVRTTNRKQHEM